MNPIYPTIQALLASPDVTAIVGPRVEFIDAPQSGVLPDIIVNMTSSADTILLTGPGKYPDGRIRIECRARTKSDAVGLGDVVVDYLDGLRGTFAGMDVTSFLKEATDVTDSADDLSTYRRIIDFRVRFRTAV